MRVLAIEDNELDLEHLLILLQNLEGVDLVGQATTMDRGLELIRREQPDLLLLDVQVGNRNSLDCIQELEEPPIIICMTLYEDHALKAYDVGAVDYLTKPLNAEKLRRAFDRAAPRIKGSREAKLLVVKCGSTTHRIPLDEISLIQGERDYTAVVTSHENLLCGKRMREWREELPEDRFAQLDRSLIVNLSHVGSFTPATRTCKGTIHLNSGRSIPIGHTASRSLRERLPS